VMTRSFLVWFEPVASGLFYVSMLITACSAIALLILVIAPGIDNRIESEQEIWIRKNTIRMLVVFILFSLAAVALNPFTDGPKLYDEACKTSLCE